MKHLGSKILHTARLTLRPFCVADAEQAFANWMSDPAVTKYLTWTPHDSVAFTRTLLAAWEQEACQPNAYRWAICLRESGEVVGDISVVGVDEHNARMMMGYCLSKRLWGKGIMTEAFSRVIDYLFCEVGAWRIEAHHALPNVGSGKVMQKCGLRQEGVLRRYVRLLSTGEYVDIAAYAILRPEWEAQRAK